MLYSSGRGFPCLIDDVMNWHMASVNLVNSVKPPFLILPFLPFPHPPPVAAERPKSCVIPFLPFPSFYLPPPLSLLFPLMYKRVYTFLTENNILYPYQFGFRKNHSTSLALIDVIDNIYSCLDNNETVVGVY